MNTDNIVMWETQHSSVNLDYFKTPILPEILRTQNQHQEEFLCIFGSQSHLCTDQVDVQEANFSFTQLHRSRDNFP